MNFVLDKYLIVVNQSLTKVVLYLQVVDQEKVATCNVCGKGFKGRNRHQNLQRHNLIHTGEKPFSCPFLYCSYTARQYSHIKYHVFNYHEKFKHDPGQTN